MMVECVDDRWCLGLCLANITLTTDSNDFARSLRFQQLIYLVRGPAVRRTRDNLAAWLVTAEGLRLSLDAMNIDVPYEPQNEILYRKAAQDWAQSQQCTLTCSLHGTILVFAAFHHACIHSAYVCIGCYGAHPVTADGPTNKLGVCATQLSVSLII